MLVFQINKPLSNQRSTNTALDQEFARARTYLEQTYFKGAIGGYCGTDAAPTLFYLENYLNTLTLNQIPVAYQHAADYTDALHPKSLFLQDRDALAVLVRYAHMSSTKSPLPLNDDPSLKEFCGLLGELEQGKGKLTLSNASHYLTSIPYLLTIGRMYGGSSLQAEADPAAYAALSETEKTALLYRCKQVVDAIASNPGARLFQSGFTFHDYTAVAKPDNGTPGAPFQFLGIDGPTPSSGEEYQPLQWVYSIDFLYPHYKQINRVYVPQWVADPEAIIGNGIRSLLSDLIHFGEVNGLSNDKILKFCFGNGLVYEDPIMHTLVFNEQKIEAMAKSISSKLSQQDEGVVMGRLQKLLDDNGLGGKGGISLKSQTPYSKRSTDEGNLEAFVMNYGLAESTMQLVNEYVLYPFFKAISLQPGQKNSDPYFNWSDKDYLTYLKRSLLSIIFTADPSGKSVQQLGLGISAQMQKHATRLDFDPSTPAGQSNLAALKFTLSSKPGELAEVKDDSGNSLLLRLNELGQVEVLQPSKILSVGSATHEPPVNTADTKTRDQIMAALDATDTNKLYYDTPSKAPRNPGSDPQFIGNLFIRSIAGDPQVKVALSNPGDMANFINQEAQRKVGNNKDELSYWLDSRLFCVSKAGPNGNPIPDHDKQNALVNQLNTFINTPSLSSLDLVFGPDLSYHLQRSGDQVLIQNTSPAFAPSKNAFFSIVSSDGAGGYSLDPSNQADFVDWMASRKLGKGEDAEEIRGYACFFYLNDVQRRYIGIGAFAPTRLGLESAQPVYRVNKTDASVTINFILHNMYAPDPLQTTISGPDVHFYLDLYSPYSTTQTDTIPYLPITSGLSVSYSQNSGTFTIPTSLFKPTQYAQFTYSSGAPGVPFLPSPPLYSGSGKKVEMVFPFDASRHRSDRYLAMVQAQLSPQQDFSSRVYTGDPLQKEHSVECAHHNDGCYIDISTDEKVTYQLRMLERPKLNFEMSGFLSGIIPRDEKSILPRPRKETATQNVLDESVNVWPPRNYSGAAPVMGGTSYSNPVYPSSGTQKSRQSAYDAARTSSLAEFNQGLSAQGVPALTQGQLDELLKTGHLDIGGASGYHVWVGRSPNVAQPSYSIGFCSASFYRALREHVHDNVLSEQSEHDLTDAIQKTLGLTAPPTEINDDIINSLTDKTLTSMQRANALAAPAPGSAQTSAPFFIASTSHYIQLEHTADGPLIHPGRQVIALKAYDLATRTGSSGYVSVSGEGIGVPKDYPFRVQGPDGTLTNDIPLSGVPMAICMVGAIGPAAINPGSKANTYSVSQHLVLQAADGESAIPLEFENGGAFTLQKNQTMLDFSLPVFTSGIDGTKRPVGRVYYTYDRPNNACTLQRFEAEPEFTQFLIQTGHKNFYQSVKLDDLGHLSNSEIVVNGEYGRPFMSGDIDWSRQDEINARLLPYLSSMAPWQVAVPELDANNKPKLDAQGQPIYNEYDLNVRVETPGAPASNRTLILSYPRGSKVIDLFRVFQDPNGFRVQPIEPAQPNFERYLKDVFEGTFGKTTSMLDDEYFRQVPTRGPYSPGWFG
ncbi:Uncharacterised protein [uncultured archaeon]|nr:Uncharacterised protein [uncultured archaeon]